MLATPPGWLFDAVPKMIIPPQSPGARVPGA